MASIVGTITGRNASVENLTVTGNASIAGTLGVTGLATLVNLLLNGTMNQGAAGVIALRDGLVSDLPLRFAAVGQTDNGIFRSGDNAWVGVAGGAFSHAFQFGAGAQTGSLTVGSALAVEGPMRFTGPLAPPQIVANADDYAPTGIGEAMVLRLATDAARDLTGITTGADGRVLFIQNVGAFDLNITNDATSTAANRFLTVSGATLALTPGAMAVAVYDPTATRWRVGKLA